MSPIPELLLWTRSVPANETVTKPTNQDGLILEAWAEGYMVGSLIILTCITFANMRRGVLLHKLIMLELIFGYWQGFFIFFHPPIYAWWLSVAAIPLNMSWSLHNVIAWIKIKPFLSKPVSYVFIGTVILVQPYWVVEIYANFTYFHNVNQVFLKTRPWEALCRDPWWVATTIFLFYSIKTKYDLPIRDIVRISPRFAVLLGAMLLSIAFIVLDVLSVTSVLKGSLPVGINPFWKLSFVFKCLTDTVVLDDFKTALDRLRAFKQAKLGGPLIVDGNGDATHKKKHDAAAAAQLQNSNNNSWAMAPTSSANGTPVKPAMTGANGEYGQRPTAWEEIKIHSTHVEGKGTGGVGGGMVGRNPSRDRDDDTGLPMGIDALDFDDLSPSPPHRGTSQAPLVNGHHDYAGHEHWPSAHTTAHHAGVGGEDEDDDVSANEEYADAMRQVVAGDGDHTTSNRKGGEIGKGR